MRTPAPRIWRAITAMTLAAGLLLAGGVAAQAGKPTSKDRTTTAVVSSVACTSPPTATYSVTSSRASADVEIRWRVYTGQILEFGGTYVVQRARVTTNTSLKATAPTGYSVTSVTVAPVKKNGRSAGGTGYAQVACP